MRSFYRACLLICIAAPNVCVAGQLSRGHQVLIDRGLQIQGLAWPDYLIGPWDQTRWAQTNFTGINYWDQNYPTYMPPLPWSTKLSAGVSTLPAYENTYAAQLVRIQLGDEQDVTTPAERAFLSSAVQSLHVQYPNVIVNTNQPGGTMPTVAQMQDYMRVVQPDMLMFDYYTFDGTSRIAGGSPTTFYEILETYRELALAGNDGTGSQPIPVGHFTQAFTMPNFTHVATESEIRLHSFAGWTFGVKYTDTFVYSKPPPANNIRPIMFADEYSTDHPTSSFNHVAETTRQSLNLGPALVRLISTDVRMKLGQHRVGFVNVSNSLPSGVAAWSPGADPYITNFSAQNLGSLNNGLVGDILIGYFEPIDSTLAPAGHQNDIYFMVCNGLSDRNGSAAQTRQSIRLSFDFGASGINSLLRLNRDTGAVDFVSLISDGGSLYHLDVTLDGGTGDLFKFNNGSPFIGTMSIPEPSTIFICILGVPLTLGSAARFKHRVAKNEH